VHRGCALNLLPDPEAKRLDGQCQGLQARQKLARQQRQLLSPGSGRDVNGEHTAAELARLGPARHAVAEQTAPCLPVDGHLAPLRRHDARSVEQLGQQLGARPGLHDSSGPLSPGRVNRPRERSASCRRVTSSITNLARAALCVGALGLGLASCRLRASTIPLGGKHEEEAPTKPARATGSLVLEKAEPSPEEEEAAERADEVPVTEPAPSAVSATPPSANAAPAAFLVKGYAPQQAWTRIFDLEFSLKVGPAGNIDMKMVSHQEARFRVLSINGGALEKLEIDYAVYTSTMTIMGSSQDSPEELAGKRFVVTFAHGAPEVRDASGGKPPKKQLDSVQDDAREPLEIEKSLRELAQLAAKGRGDFSQAGAVSLAGGEDDDTKIRGAHATLQRLTTGAHNERLALIDLGYTVSNALDDGVSIEAQVAGSLSVLDAPARYQTSTLQGPMEIRSTQPGGMAGKGTVKITTTYKY
jgi:hypothetical protein